MKKLILSVLLLINTSLLAQVENVGQFLEFCGWSYKERSLYLMSPQNGWKYVNKEHKVTDVATIDVFNFSTNLSGTSYVISLVSGMSKKAEKLEQVRVTIKNNEAVFNDWISKLKSSGCIFNKSGSSYVSTNTGATIFYHKGVKEYEISVTY